MNPFVSRINRASWEIPVSLLCLILGVMISLAWIKPGTRHTRALDPEQAQRVNSPEDDLKDQITKLSGQVNHLQFENTKLQNAMATESTQGKVLNQSLQEVKLFAGLTDVEGPGVTVTLKDSVKGNNLQIQNQPLSDPALLNQLVNNQIIHDTDVLRVVNELWAAGAEAIAVKNQRVTAGSSFRCVGNTILVDGTRVAPPIPIRAIGDPDTLEGGLNIPKGILDEIRTQDPAMVEIVKVKKHVLPAYTGSTQHTLLTVPKETK